MLVREEATGEGRGLIGSDDGASRKGPRGLRKPC